MKKAIDRESKKDPLVDKILEDLEQKMTDSEVDQIIVYFRNDFAKKYKITDLSDFNQIKSRVLTKLKTHGYDVKQNSPGQYYINW